MMSDANLRRILPESETIIQPTDKIIIESPGKQSTVAEFGNIIFDRENFEITNTLDNNITLARQVSADISSYVDEQTNTIVTPEILCLFFKEFTNGTGVTIGQNTIATTNLSLNYFQVSTINPFDPVEDIQFSVDASGLEDVLSDDGINLSPGIYKVECTGAFTLTGPAGSFLSDGTSIGNGDRGYLTLELYKDTIPNEALLVSTPIIDYAPEVTLTTAPTSWCGTQAEWEFFLRNNYESSVTHCAYMYGFISICKTSNIKLKAHTAGSYIIGYPTPNNESELPPSLYNPIQIIFEKITENPFEFNIIGPEVDVLATIPQTRSTTTTEDPLPPLTALPPLPPAATTPRPRRIPSGERIFKSPGATTWVVPNGVDTISVVCVGAGGGGAATNDAAPHGANGGDLRWRNNIKVTPGSRLWINVGEGGTSFKSNVKKRQDPGTDGGDTEIRRSNKTGQLILRAQGGRAGQVGKNLPGRTRDSSTKIDRSKGIGGGNGGIGGRGGVLGKATSGGGGGGAGGYTGSGGNGGPLGSSGSAGRGGAGGGGSGGRGTGTAGGGGGGVGLFGSGTNGAGGTVPTTRENGNAGKTGSRNLHKGIDLREPVSFGMEFGGGGGAKGEFMGGPGNQVNRQGGRGAVRIIWGQNRNFPNNAK